MAKANLTKTANVAVAAREIDFVTRFGQNWDALRDLMGIMRPIRKQPGYVLKAKTAAITLQPGNVGEGEEVPYSLATVSETPIGTLAIEKYAKAVSLEAINDHGYEAAVAMTDAAFLNELQSGVMQKFYTFLNTGSLTASYIGFQKSLAMARGGVQRAFKNMHKDVTEIVGFVNILDAYQYLGTAEITIQTAFGINYIQNFLGYRTIFLCGDNEVASGTVIACPRENINLYYISPADSEFSKAGLEYTVDGVTPLIGFHTQGNYNTVVSECFALLGMGLFAEYLNGIAVVTVLDEGGTEVPFA